MYESKPSITLKYFGCECSEAYTEQLKTFELEFSKYSILEMRNYMNLCLHISFS